MVFWRENVKKQKEALAEGKGKGVSREYVTVFFGVVAVETLVTNRYVDGDKTFYKTAENYMDWLLAFNERLSGWPSRPESVEPWLLDEHKNLKSRIEKFGTLVTEHKNAIETIL